MPRRRCIRSPARASISVCAMRPAWRRCSRTDVPNSETLRSRDGLWLERYREWREADRTNIVRFTDGLVRLFGPSARSRRCATSACSRSISCRRRRVRCRSSRRGSRADPETGARRERSDASRFPHHHRRRRHGWRMRGGVGSDDPRLAELRIAVLEAHPPTSPPPSDVDLQCPPCRVPRSILAAVGAWPLVPRSRCHPTRK